MVTQAQKRATTKYENKTFDKITLRLRKDGTYGLTRDEIQKRAELLGMSSNEYIIYCIKAEMNEQPNGNEIERIPYYD